MFTPIDCFFKERSLLCFEHTAKQRETELYRILSMGQGISFLFSYLMSRTAPPLIFLPITTALQKYRPPEI